MEVVVSRSSDGSIERLDCLRKRPGATGSFREGMEIRPKQNCQFKRRSNISWQLSHFPSSCLLRSASLSLLISASVSAGLLQTRLRYGGTTPINSPLWPVINLDQHKLLVSCHFGTHTCRWNGEKKTFVTVF